MSSTTPKSAYFQGLLFCLPFVLIAAPFGLLFGVVATKAGLNLLETMSFTVVVIAGAAQFTALSLMEENAPTVIIIISALAVNLRMAMYSAALVPYLGHAPLWQRAFAAYFLVDQVYVFSHDKYERDPDLSVPARMAFFMGCATAICPVWYVATYIGAVVGTQIPAGLGLDFAVPIAFIAMAGSMLRTPAHVVAAFVGCVVALLTAGIPYSLGLIIAGLCGMIAGAQTEVRLEKRA